MRRFAARLLFWTPRVITIAFAISLGLFALDVFNEIHEFWRAVIAFAIGLTPAYIVVAVLIAAWRWEWIGAMAYALLAAIYAMNAIHRHFLSWPIFLMIPLPLLVIAGLFLANWTGRAKLRSGL